MGVSRLPKLPTPLKSLRKRHGARQLAGDSVNVFQVTCAHPSVERRIFASGILISFHQAFTKPRVCGYTSMRSMDLYDTAL
jgi:hypothetical protein